MIPRRGLLAGLGALLAAPAIIRTPGLLMPVKALAVESVYQRYADYQLISVGPEDVLRISENALRGMTLDYPSFVYMIGNISRA